MGKFTTVSADAFNQLQLDAGVVLSTFDPANPRRPTDAEIITATTGGIQTSLEPTFSDLGEDVDNVPTNMLELKHLDYWSASMTFTAIGMSADMIKMALGAADITDTVTYDKVVPRKSLKSSDFKTIWWVGDLTNGGAAAIELTNALSTGGFSLQTTKSGKGNLSVTITGHVSINAQNVVPMNFYIIEPDQQAGG